MIDRKTDRFHVTTTTIRIQKSFIISKNSLVLSFHRHNVPTNSIPLLPIPGNHWSLSLQFCVFENAHKWNHTICNPLRLSSFTQHNAVEIYPAVASLYPVFFSFLLLSNILMCGCTTVCLSINLLNTTSFW